MKNSILVILVLSLIVVLGCEKKTETAEDSETSKDKTVVQTQEAVGKSEILDVKEEEPAREIFITIKEGKFEPDAFEIRRGEKVKFRIKSLDVQHTFTVDTLGIKEMINPGEEIIVETTLDTGAPFIHFHCDIHGGFFEKGTMTIK